jgi:sigma-B regulation protein RsbU (phosphoserine phosphatase)
MTKARRRINEARRFLADYTEGLNVNDLRRLFDQDAARAYEVLSRERPTEASSQRASKRLLTRLKIVFLGLSYKLSPARRILFVVSLSFALLGVLSPSVIEFDSEASWLTLEFSPLWFLASISGLLWLLMMELVDRVRVRDELEVARKLQADLLPSHSPQIDGYAFAHSYRTANEVGGDYYDFQLLQDGRLAVLVGDASGHGIAAGLLMAISNATIQTALELDPEPRAVASLLNGTLYRTGDRRAFMTLFYALLDPKSGQLDYVCAGHPFPLLRRNSGEILELGAGALPLGLHKAVDPVQSSVVLEPGDLLLLFTDGLPESIGGDQAKSFGFDRLQDLVDQAGSAQTIHDRVMTAFDRHIGDEPITDDVTTVVLKRLSDEPPPLPAT